MFPRPHTLERNPRYSCRRTKFSTCRELLNLVLAPSTGTYIYFGVTGTGANFLAEYTKFSISLAWQRTSQQNLDDARFCYLTAGLTI